MVLNFNERLFDKNDDDNADDDDMYSDVQVTMT